MLHDTQTFLSLYNEPNVVEIATGGEDSFDSIKSWQRETKQMGQVATPEHVATLMAKWVMSLKPLTVLDPASGLGGLLAACRRINTNVVLVGVERDSETLQRAKATAPQGTKLILSDYLKSDAGLFDGIIANPPYVKAQRLEYSEADWCYFEERLGTKLDRLTNLYALFLLKIWEDLAPHGRAAVILPSEFLNANFGDEIKVRLVRAIRPTAIVIFSPTLNVFAGTLTTSAIVLLDKGRMPNIPIWSKLAESVNDAEDFIEKLLKGEKFSAGKGLIDLAPLNPQTKWLNLLLNGATENAPMIFKKCIGDYFKSRRGIATGANEFFCLSRTGIREHQLIESDFDKCITKATDAEGLVFTHEKFNTLVNSDRRCFLLNPSQTEGDIARYLELGQQQEIQKRHLPSHRPVWYRPESRAAADIWVAVFSRESVKFILNTSGAKNLTCFHGLYAKPSFEFLAPLMVLFLNSSWGRIAFTKVNRFYGSGLNKLEPKDVESMPCPEFPKQSSSEAERLRFQLLEFEKLSDTNRQSEIDRLAASLLHLPDLATA